MFIKATFITNFNLNEAFTHDQKSFKRIFLSAYEKKLLKAHTHLRLRDTTFDDHHVSTNFFREFYFGSNSRSLHCGSISCVARLKSDGTKEFLLQRRSRIVV